MKSFFLFLTLLFVPLCASADSLQIELPTSANLSPLYIGHFRIEACVHPASYVEKLEEVFRRDFTGSGQVYLSPYHPECETLLAKENPQEKFSAQTWRSLSLPFVLDAHGKRDKLSFTVFCLSQEKLKQFGEIPLTGNLDLDRRALHRACDGIIKSLFNVEGIASRKILFSLQKKGKVGEHHAKWEAEIFECDADGANVRQVTKDKSYAITPAVIPTKNREGSKEFLYVSYKLSQPKIYLGQMQNGASRRLVELRGNQLLPTVSPDGSAIAFICDASGRADLFIQKLQGTKAKPVQLFSFPHATQASPTFSPDGKTLAFVSDKDGSPRIYTIPASTSGKRAQATLISKAYKESTCPCWSPDGKRLTYSTKIDGVRQICLYDFATKEERQLTYGPDHKENPAWAPNSHHLIFNSIGAETAELFILNLHDPRPIQIMTAPGKKQFPAWRE